MELNLFIEKRPYLYHLTDKQNLPNMLKSGKILSTKNIVELSDIKNKKKFLGTKRSDHVEIQIGAQSFRIRDQKPISEVVLGRSLTDGWSNADFIAHLNKRVFFWPTVERLERHFKRYSSEKPIILRLATKDLLELHPNAEFCRLNSGATRCSSHWNGNAPERGSKTFLSANKYDLSYASVAEVTVPNYCNLPLSLWKSTSPRGKWELMTQGNY